MKLKMEEKYRLYELSVQNPGNDIRFINREFKKKFKKVPLTLREDFCGTGIMAMEWSRQSSAHFSYGIDLDPAPLEFGNKFRMIHLKDDVKSRVNLIEGNVLAKYKFKTDVIVAFNFSYFLFKERDLLVKYFKNVKSHLKKDGAFFIDLFGGSEARKVQVESAIHPGHIYYWDCAKYNPLTGEVLYHIHFKDKKTKKTYKKVFTYDWRMWDAKELLDVLADAGFKHTQIYWEGVDKNGDGNGVFYETQKATNCESWVTYIMAY